MLSLPLLAAVAMAPAFGPAGPVHARLTGARLATVPRLAIESSSSLETEFEQVKQAAEFEAVKAATTIAESLQPVLAAPPRRRKRDRIRSVLRRVGSVITLPRDLTKAAKEIVDDSCDVDAPEVCTDESVYKKTVGNLVGLIGRTLRLSRGDARKADLDEEAGDAMEAGWESKAQGSALKRTTEVWAFLGSAALKVLKARKTKGTAEEVSAAKTAAAEYIRDSLFRLGPTFVKLGQVISTRSDLLEKEYIQVLQDLQDRVPGFDGAKAKAIVAEELGRPVEEVFDSFDLTPIAAASLGQVHRAMYKVGLCSAPHLVLGAITRRNRHAIGTLSGGVHVPDYT